MRNKKSVKNNLLKSNDNTNKSKKNAKSKKNYGIDYYNQILLSPCKHERSNTSYKIFKNHINENNVNKDILNPSDILLMNNYNNFPYSKKSEIMELKGNKYNRYEKYKLKNIAEMLDIQRQENNEIILNNKKEIGNLKKRISFISLKLKNIYEQQN